MTTVKEEVVKKLKDYLGHYITKEELGDWAGLLLEEYFKNKQEIEDVAIRDILFTLDNIGEGEEFEISDLSLKAVLNILES